MYYEKFVELLQAHNTSAYKVSKETKIASSNFTDWKNGKITPKISTLQKIADYFDVPIGFFFNNEQEKESVPTDVIIQNFLLLDSEDRKEIEEIIKIKLKKPKYLKK